MHIHTYICTCIHVLVACFSNLYNVALNFAVSCSELHRVAECSSAIILRLIHISLYVYMYKYVCCVSNYSLQGDFEYVRCVDEVIGTPPPSHAPP